jgi:predicted transcriptional regulator
MGKISPFVKLLRGEYELTVLAVLTKLGGKARADEIIKAGKKTKTLPSLNGARVASVRKFLLKHELIKIKKEGHEIIHQLTPRGRKLGKLLNNISDFILKELKWKN